VAAASYDVYEDGWRHEDVPNIDWPSLEEVIRAMDADNRSIVTISTSEAWHMGIGGGAQKYVVYIQWMPQEETGEEEAIWSLFEPANAGESQLTFVSGGQYGVFSGRQVVGVEKALQAAKYYFQHEKPDPSLYWDLQGSATPPS
jgi:hypothetical protein